MKNKFFVYQPDGDGCSEFVAFDGAFGESILDEAECVKMLNGFNSTCDANQALIAKQAEQIKMLIKALEEIGGYDKIDVSNRVFDIAEKALEATKPVED